MKPTIPKGTRDFSPMEMVRRNYIFDTIREVFQLFGYLPIETPAMENMDTLMGKYGEEGDRLIFKILNSGDFLKDIPAIKDVTVKKISDKALRYDLTVPFARYVVQHKNEIVFPFKRYQLQPVWRADRPQKGRYREFYQCDADVIGSDSLLNEVELIKIIENVFFRLNIPVVIKMNNRKILAGISEVIGATEKIVDITVAIDKLDKIGIENVNKELKEKGVSDKAIEQLQPLINFKGSNLEKVQLLTELLASSEIGMKGIMEIKQVMSYLSEINSSSTIELDITLARGLNYYTGAIFEVKSASGSLYSSICGGGRYDDLTGIFGLPGMSGVGISFGADRIYDVMEEMNLFPAYATTSTKLLFVNFGENESLHCLRLLETVRNCGIRAEMYPDAAKIKKQFDYAHKKSIPFVAVIGSEEIKTGLFTLKEMNTGNQTSVDIHQLVNKLKEK